MGGHCVQVDGRPGGVRGGMGVAGPASGATRWNNSLRVWRILRQR